MTDAGDTAAEMAAARELWTRTNREYGDDHADRAWASKDIAWGAFNVPERDLGVLGDVRGLDVIELGCGTPTSPRGWPGGKPGRPAST
jgi:hypothetical protein